MEKSAKSIYSFGQKFCGYAFFLVVFGSRVWYTVRNVEIKEVAP